MFRLVNYDDEGAGELFRYLSGTASKVIWNALNIWGGSIPAILDIYLEDLEIKLLGALVIALHLQNNLRRFFSSY